MDMISKGLYWPDYTFYHQRLNIKSQPLTEQQYNKLFELFTNIIFDSIPIPNEDEMECTGLMEINGETP